MDTPRSSVCLSPFSIYIESYTLTYGNIQILVLAIATTASLFFVLLIQDAPPTPPSMPFCAFIYRLNHLRVPMIHSTDA